MPPLETGLLCRHVYRLDKLPGALDATRSKAADKLLKSSRGQVQRVVVAATAAVNNLDLARIAPVVGADHPAARTRAVEQVVAHGDNHLAVVVGLAAGAEASVVVGEVAGVASREMVHVLFSSGGSSRGSEREGQDGGGDSFADGVHVENKV